MGTLRVWPLSLDLAMMVARGGLTFYDDERVCIHYGAMVEVGWVS